MMPRALPPVRSLIGLALLVPFLAACASTGATTASRPIKGGAVREPVRAPPRDPTFQTIAGLEGVIGADESSLVRQFGAPRLNVWEGDARKLQFTGKACVLNVWEGDARKLQFTGKACVLDVFLYPTAQSKDPLASYVDARRSSDGQDVDRAACVAALKTR